jgi:hypothetical protein
MQDAHTLWHQALSEYQSPDRFRVSFQNCIQSLRTVTWLLQSQKHAFPEFEPWYQTWQERMRSDLILRWLVEARNHIEQRGDLETHSSVRGEVIASYIDDFPLVTIDVRLFESLESIFSKVPRVAMEEQILRHGVVRVERRWVATDLPEYELLDALYLRLREIVTFG